MNNNEQTGVTPEEPASAPDTNSPEMPIIESASKKPSKKRLPLIIAVVAAVVVVIIAIILVNVLGKGSSDTPASSSKTSSAKAATISAVIGDDASAYLAIPNGECIKINEEVHTAYLTADRKHVVVLLEDKTLYFTDPQLSSKTVIADDAIRIVGIRDDGLVYRDAADNYYRATYSGDQTVEIGNDLAVTIAENTLSVLYAKKDGTIWTLPYTAAEGTKVGNYDSEVFVRAISDDGQLAVWNMRDDSQVSIVLSDNEERTTLGTIDNKYAYSSTVVNFTTDQKLAVIANTYDEQIYIVKPGEEPLKVKLGSELSSSTVYTADGLLTSQAAQQVDGLYVTVKAETGSNLYYISMDGERERVLSKISRWQTGDGRLFYLDDSSALYSAKLDGAALSEEEKITSDASRITLSENGQYLYYMRNCEDGVGTLYCYHIGDTEGVKIDSNVYCPSWATIPYYQVGNDGATVYYAKDAETNDDTYDSYGSLYVWNWNDGESKKLASDVIVNYLDSGLTGNKVNTKGFIYHKYNSVDSDRQLHVDVYYCDGNESTKLASDCISQNTSALEISSDDPSEGSSPTGWSSPTAVPQDGAVPQRVAVSALNFSPIYAGRLKYTH